MVEEARGAVVVWDVSLASAQNCRECAASSLQKRALTAPYMRSSG